MIRSASMAVALALAASTLAACAAFESRGAMTPRTGRVLIQNTTPQSERVPFAGHPGWISLFHEGDPHEARGFRPVDENAEFQALTRGKPGTAILSFGKMETPPVIVHNWPNRDSGYDIVLQPDYAVYPAGYPETWDEAYRIRDKVIYQTFQSRGTALYGVTVFDASKTVWWGNKVRFRIHAEGPEGDFFWHAADDGSPLGNHMSAQHTDYGTPRAGWRPGDIDLVPGRTYAIQVSGYQSHGNEHFDAHLFVRPDGGDGYAPGEAFGAGRQPLHGDLCMLLWGNGNGQIVENQVRTEEWEIFLPRRTPSKHWGQTFLSHGRSLAGITLWSSHPGTVEPPACRVRLREDGPEGRVIGTEKIAPGRISPERPTIRYPDWPGVQEAYAAHYDPPYVHYALAWAPDETPLEPGRSYYIEMEATEPVILFADGDADPTGFAYHEGLRIDDAAEPKTFHSARWTIAMAVVTWQNPGGAPNRFTGGEVWPDDDGNLVINGGAETGDFRGWTAFGGVAINPDPEFPDPQHQAGAHHFGCHAVNQAVEAGHYQAITGLEPGAEYELSFYSCRGDGTNEWIEALWIDGGFGGDEAPVIVANDAPRRRWHLHTGTLSPSGTSGTLVIRYRHADDSGTATFHVDDIVLRRRP